MTPLANIRDNVAGALDNRLVQYVSEKNANRLKNAMAELAFAALAMSANSSSVNPVRFYSTTAFIESCKAQLGVETPEQTASPHDVILYHAMLYVAAKTFLCGTNWNDPYVLSLLSSPLFINFICGTPWFKSLRNKCMKVGLKSAFNKAQPFLKRQMLKYGKHALINTITEAVTGKESFLARSVTP